MGSFKFVTWIIFLAGSVGSLSLQLGDKEQLTLELNQDYGELRGSNSDQASESSEIDGNELEDWHLYAILGGGIFLLVVLVTFTFCFFTKCWLFAPTSLNSVSSSVPNSPKMRPSILIARNPVPAPFLMERQNNKEKILENENLPKMTLNFRRSQDLPPPYPGAPPLRDIRDFNSLSTASEMPPSYKQSTVEIWL